MKALIKNQTNTVLSDVVLDNNNEDVLLKVKNIGLCRTDLLVANGTISVHKDNLILGHEFCASVVHDPLNQFKKDQLVGINPLFGKEFMGLDIDGAICEYIYMPHSNIIPTSLQDIDVIAYLEPVAASMAVLKAIDIKEKQNIAIVGNNRIAYLTKIILDSYQIDCDILNENDSFKEDFYDLVIETTLTNNIFSKIIRSLKPGKTLVFKSRKKDPINICVSELVAKEINIKSVNYYSFEEAMRWLEKNHVMIKPLLGESFMLKDWKTAFEQANSGEQKKIFIRM